jgi:hypothetical protein
MHLKICLVPLHVCTSHCINGLRDEANSMVYLNIYYRVRVRVSIMSNSHSLSHLGITLTCTWYISLTLLYLSLSLSYNRIAIVVPRTTITILSYRIE